MELLKVPTYEQILPYIENKLISENIHPEDPDVRIFNYTQKCQFTHAWDDITRQCRGLILNVRTGEVLARPFPKFFNYGEHVSKGWAVPTGEPIVTEKLDGSLGILYRINGTAYIATRGSFTSEQAVWATQWWRDNIEDSANFEPGLTNLFEIIIPWNRIVVSYEFSGLVHLTTLDNVTSRPVAVRWDIFESKVRQAKEIPFTDLEALSKMEEPNSEGFVLYYPSDNVRMKIKFAEYVRLHKLVTGVNEIAIWEHLRSGSGLDDLVDKVPDEFMQWVTDTSNALIEKKLAIENKAIEEFTEIEQRLADAGTTTRKDYALSISHMQHPSIGFAMLDEKPTAPIIWRMVRPHGAHAFKIDIDL